MKKDEGVQFRYLLSLLSNHRILCNIHWQKVLRETTQLWYSFPKQLQHLCLRFFPSRKLFLSFFWLFAGTDTYPTMSYNSIREYHQVGSCSSITVFNPISFQIPEHHRCEEWWRTNRHDQELCHEDRFSKVVVDHVSDLSFEKEPIVFLSFLFLQTDIFFLIGILNDLVQRRSNSRVQHFEIREISTLIWSRWLKFINWNRPSPPFWSITWPSRENRSKNSAGFWIWIFQHENVEGLEIEASRFAVFADES